MFEDSLVESSNKVGSKSKYWMVVTFALNLALVALAVLLPLLHPAALPKTAMLAMLVAPPPPPPASPVAETRAAKSPKVMKPLNPMTAPARVPARIDRSQEPLPSTSIGSIPGGSMIDITGSTQGIAAAIGIVPAPPVFPQPVAEPKHIGPVRISSGVAAGAIVSKTTPVYPPIARAAHVSGSVVLHAIISKTGAIESLQVVSGPEMLRASALDAVRQWRYRPYLLNGDPTEVETSISVNFSFQS